MAYTAYNIDGTAYTTHTYYGATMSHQEAALHCAAQVPVPLIASLQGILTPHSYAHGSYADAPSMQAYRLAVDTSMWIAPSAIVMEAVAQVDTYVFYWVDGFITRTGSSVEGWWSDSSQKLSPPSKGDAPIAKVIWWRSRPR